MVATGEGVLGRGVRNKGESHFHEAKRHESLPGRGRAGGGELIAAPGHATIHGTAGTEI